MSSAEFMDNKEVLVLGQTWKKWTPLEFVFSKSFLVLRPLYSPKTIDLQIWLFVHLKGYYGSFTSSCSWIHLDLSKKDIFFSYFILVIIVSRTFRCKVSIWRFPYASWSWLCCLVLTVIITGGLHAAKLMWLCAAKSWFLAIMLCKGTAETTSNRISSGGI